jgi:amiloride-sensitive sodium channel
MKKILIYFHLPNEIFTVDGHDKIILKQNEVTSIELDIVIHRMEESLKKFPIELRKCYFEDERKLKFFKHYSVYHCKLECFSNITYKNFGCVKFYMPRDSKTRICKFSELIKLYSQDDDLTKCNCLSLCNYIKFNYKVATSPNPSILNYFKAFEK